MNLREDVFSYVEQAYGTKPEYPWLKMGVPTDPIWVREHEAAVLRHSAAAGGAKPGWYGLVMEVKCSVLGIGKTGSVQILNVKCDPQIGEWLRRGEGYLPAYHMNKMNWITILLDGTVPMDNIAQLIDESFALTESKKGMRKGRNNGPRDWLVPANPRLFDLIAAFESRDELYWTQSSQVRPGDLVYIYVGVPYSAVMYKCKALEVDIPAENGKHMMRIRLLAKYEPGVMPLPRMREEFGVYGVRGPRSIPHSMKMELQHHE